MLNSANQAWTMYPGLAHGAYSACAKALHGTDEQKALYLPKLVSGQWVGTMCLTEAIAAPTSACAPRPSRRPTAATASPAARSSSAAASTTWPRTSSTWCSHACPSRRQGIKGISLFVVPKFLPAADGSLGARNAIWCNGLEHKMGINASATCQIGLEGATGWLVGQPTGAWRRCS